MPCLMTSGALQHYLQNVEACLHELSRAIIFFVHIIIYGKGNSSLSPRVPELRALAIICWPRVMMIIIAAACIDSR